MSSTHLDIFVVKRAEGCAAGHSDTITFLMFPLNAMEGVQMIPIGICNETLAEDTIEVDHGIPGVNF
jgi:hypothetical protein